MINFLFHRSLLVSLVAALAIFSSCSDNRDHSDQIDHSLDHSDHDHALVGLPHIEAVDLDGRKLKVVASTSVIGDVVNSVVGDEAELTILMPRGQNPHSWSPTPGEIAVLEQADLIFINGLDLETELLGILESMRQAVVVSVSTGLDLIEVTNNSNSLGNDDHEHLAGDPHTWFSPLNVMHWVVNIEYALTAIDPGKREVYERGADAFQQILQNLDVDIRTMVDQIPEEERRLVTDHSTISYFARDYGFTIVGNILPATNDQAEPSARQIAELVSLVRDEDIRAIFVSNTAGRSLVNLAESVAAESGRNVPVVRILTGSLAEEGQRGSDYSDFIRYNTELIVESLL